MKAGEPLVWYMGDDSRNEYIYKFVSKRAWDPRDAYGGMAAGDKYLDDGTLYVAQFLPDGSGSGSSSRSASTASRRPTRPMRSPTRPTC